MAWRYCCCGAAQDQITLDDLEAISYDETALLRCSACDEPRDDDTPNTRFSLLLREVIELRKKFGSG